MKTKIGMLGTLGTLAILAAFGAACAGCGGGSGDAGTTERPSAGPAATAPAAPAAKTTTAPPASTPPGTPQEPTITLPSGAAAGDTTETKSAPSGDAAKADPPPASQTTADKMIEDYLEAFDEIATAFKGVTDEASAKAAGETIRDVVSRMKEQQEQWKTLAPADVAATSIRYSQKLRDAESKLTQALLPVMMNQTYAQHVKDAMTGMPTFPSGR